MYFKNCLFGKVTLKNIFLMEQFWKCLLWGSNFKNFFFGEAVFKKFFLKNIYIFKGAILEMHFLRE